MRFAVLLLLVAHGAAAFDEAALCGPRQAYTPIAERATAGMLFVVESCGRPASHLLGTMHSDDPALPASMPKALAALAASDTAIFELVETPRSAALAMRHLTLPKGQTLPGIVGAELFAGFVTHMRQIEASASEAVLAQFRPWAAAILLQYPPPVADGRVFDLRLQDIARERKLRLAALETPAEQFGFFEKLTAAEQRMMLEDAVKHYDESAALNRELEAAYRRGDLAAIARLSDRAFAEMEDRAFAEKLQLFLITGRNRKMLTRLLPQLRQGKQFVAVGALHLTGPDGLLAGLEKQGYFISQP